MQRNILDEIFKNKRKEIDDRKRKKIDFGKHLLNSKHSEIAIIAEIKLRSPSSGELGRENEVLKKASDYELGGVDCLSVVTDKKYFGGDIEFIKKIKAQVSLPILQKDFVIDGYQIYEAKVIGSDAILLIAKILTEDKLKEFVNLCYEIGIEPVVEVYDLDDLKKTLKTKAQIIGVNARNLQTFKVEVKKAADLLTEIPAEKIKIGFSGVHSRVEVELYKKAGAKAVLIGTALMKAKNIRSFIKKLL